MTIYKNNKTNEFYVLVAPVFEYASRYLNIRDKYTYTIPNIDMVLWLHDSDIDYYI